MRRVFLVLNGTPVRRIAALLNPKFNGIKSVFVSEDNIVREQMTASQTAQGMIDFMKLKVSEHLSSTDLNSIDTAIPLIVNATGVDNLIVVLNSKCHKALPGQLAKKLDFKNLNEGKALTNGHSDHIVIIDYDKKTVDYLGAGVAPKKTTVENESPVLQESSS